MNDAVLGCNDRTSLRCGYSRIFIGLSLVLLAFLQLAPSSALASPVEDVVVINENDPVRSFNVSDNDDVAGGCAANGQAAESRIKDCVCNPNAVQPTLSPLVDTASHSGLFSYQPATNTTGLDQYAYQVWDGDTPAGCDDDDSALVSVVINDNPTLASPIPDVAVPEDAPDTVIALGVHFSDADLGLAPPFTDELTYVAVILSGAALFDDVSVDGENLKLDYAADQSGTATIQVTVTDNRLGLAAIVNFVTGNSVTTAFDVNVGSLNDAPVVPSRTIVSASRPSSTS